MRGRPLLYTKYSAEMALVPTWTKRVFLVLFLFLLVLIPLQVIPFLSFLGDSDWMRILSEVLIFAVGALGLHILSGLTGQVSLGHAFFMGVGAYTALTQAMRTGDVSAVTPFRYTRLIFGIALGVLVFGETLDMPTLVGSAIVVASGLYILARGRR